MGKRTLLLVMEKGDGDRFDIATGRCFRGQERRVIGGTSMTWGRGGQTEGNRA